MNFDILDRFGANVIDNSAKNSFNKIRVKSDMLCDLLNFLKNNAEFDFDMLNTIIAIDLGLEANQFELIYDLYSTKMGQNGRVSVLLDRNSPHVLSIVSIYKSAYFDECEIFDLFGIIFDKNPNLKRLLMPKGWVGYPLRKDYKQDDSRLMWNEVK